MADSNGGGIIADVLPAEGTILRALRLFKLTQYGPEQVDFLRYRPVLGNRRLKEQPGYVPKNSTREAFEVFTQGRKHGDDA